MATQEPTVGAIIEEYDAGRLAPADFVYLVLRAARSRERAVWYLAVDLADLAVQIAREDGRYVGPLAGAVISARLEWLDSGGPENGAEEEWAVGRNEATGIALTLGWALSRKTAWIGAYTAALAVADIAEHAQYKAARAIGDWRVIADYVRDVLRPPA